MEDKKTLRIRYAKIRDAVTHRAEKSAAITERLLSSELLCGCRTVLLYLSFRSEPDTYALLRLLNERGIVTAVPRTDPQNHTMDAVGVTDFMDLKPGNYGILEPDPNGIASGRLPILLKDNIDLMILPGLAFDRRGYRLGYGGGYYDRYLCGYRGKSAALAFSDCVTENLPHNAHDIRIGAIVCENDLIFTAL